MPAVNECDIADTAPVPEPFGSKLNPELLYGLQDGSWGDVCIIRVEWAEASFLLPVP